MSASRLLSRALATSVGSIVVAVEAAAQGGIACLPMTRGPTYSFQEVHDEVVATANGLLTNDRGDALIQAQPLSSPSGSCLLRYRGAQTETVVCTRNIDPTSPFNSMGGGIDWNERGTIAVGGILHSGIPGASDSRIQLIEPNGAVFALPTYDTFPSNKSYPAITPEGDVFYFELNGNLQRFDPTLPGDDKSVNVVLGSTVAIRGVEPAGGGRLYYNAPQRLVGSIDGALGPTPSRTTFEIDDAPSGGVVTPNRFGAFVYFTATEIRRRRNIGGVDFVVGDPEFVIETAGSLDAPIVTSLATLAGPCKVALLGRARGVCRDGPSDGLVCDADAFPDPCPNGPGGEIDGYCEHDVQGVYVHQAGTYAAVARTGDSMAGSTASVFYAFGGPQLFTGSTAGHIFFPVQLADGRRVVVRADPGASVSFPVLATSCVGASCLFDLEPAGWLGVGANGVPLYFDPDVATGFDYSLDEGDPLFASVIVPDPLPNGDADFTLIVGEASVPLAAGEQVDLTQFDPLGVEAFSIYGIDPGEELDPEDATFVTGVTFMEERTANVTMTAVVPEPGAMALGAAALGALATLARRRRTARY